MAKEIIKYVGEPARPVRPNEKPPRTGKTIEFWQVLEERSEPPTIDPATQRKVLLGWEVKNGFWEAQWTVESLTAEEQTENAKVDYLTSLDWKAFAERLIKTGAKTAGSPYQQLTEWSQTFSSPKFADCKLNIASAINFEDPELLQIAMGALKQSLGGGQIFSPSQEQEIEDCLQILGVDFTWATL